MEFLQTTIAIIVGVLDSLPDSIRAMLSALVLAVALHHLSRRIAPAGAGFNVAFRKTAIVAMIGIPLVICFALSWRFVVVVEELPTIGTVPAWVWWAVYGVWGAGALWHLFELARRYRRNRPKASGDAIPRKIESRLEIWCSRLDIDPKKVRLHLDGENRPRVIGWPRPVVILPRAAERWRTTTLDAVLLHELAHIKHKAHRWVLLAEIVAALYWPTPWIAEMTRHLNAALQRLADSRASAHLRDKMGYAAALRDMADRIGDDPDRFPIDRVVVQWENATSIRERGQHVTEYAASDPFYDRVFWALTQAVLAVFLLTGTTLREARDEDEKPSLFFFTEYELNWGRTDKYEKDLETKR